MLPKEKINTTTSENHPLQENIPAVSYDISLGKTYKNLDFDYQAFNDRANELGLSEEAIGNLSINITDGMPLNTNGAYDPQENAIRIRADGANPEDALTHQMQHAADQEKGLYGNTTKRAIGGIALRYFPTSLSVATFGVVADLMGKNWAETLTHNAIPASILMGATAIWGYYLSPEEKRARKAAETDYPDILTAEK